MCCRLQSLAMRASMRSLSRNSIAITTVSLLFLCLSQEPFSKAASSPQRSRESKKKPKSMAPISIDPLIGEWRVKCAFSNYDKGASPGAIQDKADSLVVIETDPDGS